MREKWLRHQPRQPVPGAGLHRGRRRPSRNGVVPISEMIAARAEAERAATKKALAEKATQDTDEPSGYVHPMPLRRIA